MAKRKSGELRKGDTVVAVEDLPRVPVGTEGRIEMVSGLRWTRYRVQFDNGVSLGSIDRRLLGRPGEQISSNGQAGA
jgi:hypothetical protein